MPSKSKQKGNAFEREVCTYLKGLTGLSFVRVPNSGAYIGNSNRERAKELSKSQVQTFDGDIIVPKEYAEWSFECKFYKSIAWKKLFSEEGEAKVNSWIKQARDSVKPYWMVFFKINNSGTYCIFNEKLIKKKKLKLETSYLNYLNGFVIMDMKKLWETNWKQLSNGDFDE